jgi:hypothetical protein
MKIEQKKFSTKTSFTFGDDGLTYEIRDRSGGTTFRTDYEDISFDTSFLEERNAWWRNVGWIWIVIGALGVLLSLRGAGRPALPIWLVLGVVFLIAYYWRRTSYTIYDCAKGRILIIRDDKHDQIVNELNSRRRACLRSRYATVDFGNAPEAEARRFAWMLEYEIISQEEHDTALKQISSGSSADYEE